MNEVDSLVERLMDDFVALEERVERLEHDHEELAELRERVTELEERTDMLRLIEDSDELDGRQRSAALFQHAVEKIQASDRLEQVRVDRDMAEEWLHYPNVDRTTLYSDLQRLERLAPALATYHDGDGEVTIDLTDRDPETVEVSTELGADR